MVEGSLTYKTVDVVVAQLSHQFHFLHNIPERGQKKHVMSLKLKNTFFSSTIQRKKILFV
jgi:hypothetical protein